MAASVGQSVLDYVADETQRQVEREAARSRRLRRTEYAKAAITAVCAAGTFHEFGPDDHRWPREVAKKCFLVADAMLEAEEK